MNYSEILSSIKTLLETFITEKHLDATVEVFPNEIDITDNKIHFYLDIEEVVRKKITTDNYVCNYDLKIAIAKYENDYGSFMTTLNTFDGELINMLMSKILITQITTNNFAYDSKNKCGYCEIIASVGVIT